MMEFESQYKQIILCSALPKAGAGAAV